MSRLLSCCVHEGAKACACVPAASWRIHIVPGLCLEHAWRQAMSAPLTGDTCVPWHPLSPWLAAQARHWGQAKLAAGEGRFQAGADPHLQQLLALHKTPRRLQMS